MLMESGLGRRGLSRELGSGKWEVDRWMALENEKRKSEDESSSTERWIRIAWSRATSLEQSLE
jgi:hypothetical protein